MKGYHSRELTILPSLCDSSGRLGIPDTFALFMDIATEHAEALNVGMNALMDRGLFWLTVRTRIRFGKRPRMTQTVLARTWPEPPERSRCNRDYTLTDTDGNTLIEGRTEWMVMNMKTGRLHPVDGLFPRELPIEEARVLQSPFMHMTDDFNDAEVCGEYTVRSTDIDLGGHMNNAAYIRAVAGMFRSDEWQKMDIREMEAAFRAPCYEGDRLELRRRETENGTELRFACGDRTVLLVRILGGAQPG